MIKSRLFPVWSPQFSLISGVGFIINSLEVQVLLNQILTSIRGDRVVLFFICDPRNDRNMQNVGVRKSICIASVSPSISLSSHVIFLISFSSSQPNVVIICVLGHALAELPLHLFTVQCSRFQCNCSSPATAVATRTATYRTGDIGMTAMLS